MQPAIRALDEIRRWHAEEESEEYRAMWADMLAAEAKGARFFVFVPAGCIGQDAAGKAEVPCHRARAAHPNSQEVDEVFGFSGHDAAQRFVGLLSPSIVECRLYPLPGQTTGEDLLLELEGHPESGYLQARFATHKGPADSPEYAGNGGSCSILRDDLAALHEFLSHVLARMPARN